jgi:hypothetical protein
MLSHCANQRCSKPSLRLGEGKLFLLETELGGQPGETEPPPFLRARSKRRVERYWLCDQCAIEWTLICDREQGILLTPARRPVASVPLARKLEYSEVA